MMIRKKKKEFAMRHVLPSTRLTDLDDLDDL
jgi:hypothetical protein